MKKFQFITGFARKSSHNRLSPSESYYIAMNQGVRWNNLLRGLFVVMMTSVILMGIGKILGGEGAKAPLPTHSLL